MVRPAGQSSSPWLAGLSSAPYSLAGGPFELPMADGGRGELLRATMAEAVARISSPTWPWWRRWRGTMEEQSAPMLQCCRPSANDGAVHHKPRIAVVVCERVLQEAAAAAADGMRLNE